MPEMIRTEFRTELLNQMLQSLVDPEKVRIAVQSELKGSSMALQAGDPPIVGVDAYGQA